jgi:uncharacterized membrane protein YedE/YeeE
MDKCKYKSEKLVESHQTNSLLPLLHFLSNKFSEKNLLKIVLMFSILGSLVFICPTAISLYLIFKGQYDVVVTLGTSIASMIGGFMFGLGINIRRFITEK